MLGILKSREEVLDRSTLPRKSTSNSTSVVATKVILDAPGSGKSVTCCLAVAQSLLESDAFEDIFVECKDPASHLSENKDDAGQTMNRWVPSRPQSSNLRSVTESASMIKEVASADQVSEAAQVIEGALCLAAEEMFNAKEKDPEKANAVEVWQATKKGWLNLAPGQRVPYPKASVLCYPICTTLLHSLCLANILQHSARSSLPDSKKPLRVVALCGGSGAEAVGLMLWRQKMSKCNDSNNVTKDHLDIVDILSEWSCITAHLIDEDDQASNHMIKRPRREGHSENKPAKGLPYGKYHTADLLDPQSLSKIRSLVAQADIVTLMYGLTELVDRDRPAAHRCLENVFSAMQPKARFLMIDPRKTCFGKDQWIQGLLEPNGAEEILATDLKLTMQAEDVQSSALKRWIDTFDLALNEDIKLSMHTWLRVFARSTKEKVPQPLQVECRNRMALYITYTSTQANDVMVWLNFISQDRLRVFTLDVLDTNARAAEQQSAVWHLASALEVRDDYWEGVAVLTIAQLQVVTSLLNFPYVERFCKALREKTAITVLDDAQAYFSFRKIAELTRVQQSIRAVVPALSSYSSECLVSCPRPDLLPKLEEVFSSASGVHMNIISNDNPLQSIEARTAAFFGLSVSVCEPDSTIHPQAFINFDSAVHVVFDKRVSADETCKGSHASVISLKSLQSQPATTLFATKAFQTQDLVFHLNKPLPPARMKEMIELAAFKLAAHVMPAAIPIRLHVRVATLLPS